MSPRGAFHGVEEDCPSVTVPHREGHVGLREGSGGFWIATCLEWFFLQEIPASRGTLGGPTLLECFKTWKLTDKKIFFENASQLQLAYPAFISRKQK